MLDVALLLAPSPSLRYAGRVLRRQTLGLGFVLVIVLLIATAVLAYNHSPLIGYARTTSVSLLVSNAGDQLTLPAEVELRGIDVGQVTSERLEPGGALLHLAMTRSDLSLIPSNVTAEILPKTLFGEKFVNLVIPAAPAASRLGEDGHTSIGLDDSKAALEVETVFNNLLPFLSYVQPAQLNSTLAAVVAALQGQTTALGENLVTADTYLAKLNKHLPQLDIDLERLAPVLGSYTEAAPDLLTTLANLSTNATVVTRTQDQLASFLSAAIGAAGTGTTVLHQDESDLITVAADSTPVLNTFSQYSSELPCLAGGLAALEPRLNQAFTGGALHITLQDDVDRGGYTAVDAPVARLPYTLPGPACYGLTDPSAISASIGYPGPPSANYPAGTVVSYPVGTYPNSSTAAGAGSAAADLADTTADLADGDVGSSGTAGEQREIAALVSDGGGTPLTTSSEGIGDLLLGPMLRGATVGVG